MKSNWDREHKGGEEIKNRDFLVKKPSTLTTDNLLVTNTSHRLYKATPHTLLVQRTYIHIPHNYFQLK